MAADALRVPAVGRIIDWVFCERLFSGRAPQRYQALVWGPESGLAVACRLDLSHRLELSDQSASDEDRL